ncbi:MAG: hypothetical protein ABJB66_00250 [Gemmatimonadaceae bacterium]
MTNSRRGSPPKPNRHTSFGAARTGSWLSSCVIASLALQPSIARAQNSASRRSDTPVAPSTAIGSSSTSTTFSLLGLAGLPNGDGDSPAIAHDVWYAGLSQPLGVLHAVRLTAIGTGYFSTRDNVSTGSTLEGAVAVRALGRINGVRSWAAVRYGRAGALGGVLGTGFTGAPNTTGLDGARADTTISRRVDIGTVGRAEAGILTSRGGFDFSLGMSVERATRVTTQTLSIKTNDGFPTSPLQPPALAVVRTLRGVQRREIATGLVSLGWSTGRTTWLASLTAPMAAWITSDALAPRPRIAPPVASLAVVQPITAWLSAVGSASTNASTVGSTTLRDDAGISRRSDIAPVFALGVSIVRMPFRGRHGDAAPNGILSFESRVFDALDSVSTIIQSPSDTLRSTTVAPSYRVQLIVDAPNATSIELMGDATSWTVANLYKSNDGRWRAELKIPAGANRLQVRADGGEWIAPPGLPLGNNDFGSPVGLLLVVDPARTHR